MNKELHINIKENSIYHTRILSVYIQTHIQFTSLETNKKRSLILSHQWKTTFETEDAQEKVDIFLFERFMRNSMCNWVATKFKSEASELRSYWKKMTEKSLALKRGVTLTEKALLNKLLQDMDWISDFMELHNGVERLWNILNKA